MNTQQKLIAASKIVFGGLADIQSEEQNFQKEWKHADSRALDLMKSMPPDKLAEAIKNMEQALNQKRNILKSGNQSPKAMKKILLGAVDDRLLLYQIHSKLKTLVKHISAKKISKLDLWIAHKLFFNRYSVRRCPRLGIAKLIWRIIKNKGAVANLLQEHGIYCVYTREFISGLVRLLKPYGRILEVAAGDGALSSELGMAGVKVHATDNKNWDKNIRYPDRVEDLDASAALKVDGPQAVLCSWPPSGNAFEKDIFETPSVELYIAIVSRHEYAAGYFAAYKEQSTFSMEEDADLSGVLFPPEPQHRVLIFRRIS
ncbi:MAG: hypothetical protein HZA01_07660 [Nitrospinae bacterium]|nr:hypothetical protein [Nitrospinota bacterium]